MTDYDDEIDDGDHNPLGSMRWLAGSGAADDGRADERQHADCKHEWVITGAEGPADSGFMSLTCVNCMAWGGIEFERQAEFDFVMFAYEHGFLPLPLPEIDELDGFWTNRVKVFSDPAADPPQVQLTMRRGNADGWPVRTDADIADEFKFLFGDEAPTDCMHDWAVEGTLTGGDMEGDVMIVLRCDHCHNTGYVLNPTSDELGRIEHILDKGSTVGWLNDDRVTTAADYYASVQAMAELPVAFLVNALDLFEADDDIPF